jgi:hypothetical protein
MKRIKRTTVRHHDGPIDATNYLVAVGPDYDIARDVVTITVHHVYPEVITMNNDDKAFIERHARDWWMTQVEKNERMARTYGFWFKITYGEERDSLQDMSDIDHDFAVRRFRDEIPFA